MAELGAEASMACFAYWASLFSMIEQMKIGIESDGKSRRINNRGGTGRIFSGYGPARAQVLGPGPSPGCTLAKITCMQEPSPRPKLYLTTSYLHL